jgi:hypothetical protein
LLDKFEGQRSACTLVTVDCGGQEDEVRAKELSHKREGNGGSLVDDYQFCLAKDVGILRSDVLNCLPMLPVDVDSDNGLVEIRICRLDDRIICVVRVS